MKIRNYFDSKKKNSNGHRPFKTGANRRKSRHVVPGSKGRPREFSNQMKDVEISVIMPAYNAGKYIEEAILSVILQTGGYATETIVVNDNSSDDTRAIVESMQQAYPDGRIVLINNESNLGAGGSRNLAIARAKGNYVAFLDSDDYWAADKLAKQMPLFEKCGAEFVYGARSLIDPDGKPVKSIIPVPVEVGYHQLLRTNVIPCGSVIVKKDILPNPPFVRDDIHEDYILWLRLLQPGRLAYGINEPLLHSRLAPGGKSRNKLKSAWMNYQVYRHFEIPVCKALVLMISYAIAGFKKYN